MIKILCKWKRTYWNNAWQWIRVILFIQFRRVSPRPRRRSYSIIICTISPFSSWYSSTRAPRASLFLVRNHLYFMLFQNLFWNRNGMLWRLQTQNRGDCDEGSWGWRCVQICHHWLRRSTWLRKCHVMRACRKLRIGPQFIFNVGSLIRALFETHNDFHVTCLSVFAIKHSCGSTSALESPCIVAKKPLK